jgi:hypothetical protein
MTASRGNGTTEGDVVRLPAASDRITVALIPKAGEELQRLQERTSLSKTDIVNRAITLYEFIDAQQRAGRDLLVRDDKTGEIQTVLIL